MTDTARYTVTRKITDDSGTESGIDTWTISHEITEQQTGRMVIANGAGYQSISFSGISSASVVVLRTDQALSLKINGGSEEFALTSDFIFAGTITGLQVANSSGTDANLDYEVRA